MSVTLNPYVSFRNTAREAGEFYKSVFGGELTVSTFAEGGMVDDPEDADLVMHSALTTPNGLVLMIADTPKHMDVTQGGNIAVSLSGDDVEALTGYWNALMDGGSKLVELEKAPWGDYFGMGADKYGVDWLVNISGSETPA